MATPITGIVEAIIEKPTKFGPMYDVQVAGRKYGHGKYAPRGIKQGDMVTFEYDVKQNGQYTNYNIVPRSLRTAEGGAPSAAPAASEAGQQTSAASSGFASTGKREYVAFDERQEIISKQAALNTAQNFVTFAAANGAINLPKTVKDDERLTLLRAWFLDEASKVFKLTTGRDWEMPEQDPAASPADRRAAASKARKPAAKTETSETDTGSNEWSDDFADDEIPF